MNNRGNQDDFLISTDPRLLDLDVIHAYLARSYWAGNIPRDIVERSIQHSLPFGVYQAPPLAPRKQVGFARVITDRATFAYLADVFILEPFRGLGLSKRLVETILAHPELQNLRRFCLLTADAHSLYGRYGFKAMDDPTRFMERIERGVYDRLSSERASTDGADGGRG